MGGIDGRAVAEAARGTLEKILARENLEKAIGFLVVAFLVLVSFRILESIAGRILKGKGPQGGRTAGIARKAIRYAAWTLVAVSLLDRLGLDLSAVLGAAGIAGIAVGFAAQTSIANVISGLFLVSEKPFVVGDVVTVGEVTGVVESIDMLSIKIQTFDNRFVRIPNETIVKGNLTNVTRYPVRRMDLWLTLPYEADLGRALEVLREVAAENRFALDNPEPLILVDRFEPSGVVVLFGPWFEQASFLDLKNSIMAEIPAALAAAGIRFPYPRMELRIAEGGAFPGASAPRSPAGFA